jgi:hypothetical protein
MGGSQTFNDRKCPCASSAAMIEASWRDRRARQADRERIAKALEGRRVPFPFNWTSECPDRKFEQLMGGCPDRSPFNRSKATGEAQHSGDARFSPTFLASRGNRSTSALTFARLIAAIPFPATGSRLAVSRPSRCRPMISAAEPALHICSPGQ